jgi:alcohol oxidase
MAIQHITGPRIEDHLDFKTGFLTDQDGADLKIQVWLYKVQRKVALKMQFYNGDTHHRPTFPEGSQATAVPKLPSEEENSQLDVKYTLEDDKAIERFVRENVGTAFHSIGTCKMAPEDKLGVVDKNLTVYGVKGLKIGDLSIVPSNVSGNTMSTALLIGEKAANIIIKELLLG